MRWTLARLCAAIAVFFICPDNSQAEDRLTLVETTSPYYPNLRHAKFTTPQWVDEDGVDAVIVLAIDDMRDPAKYEQYLRPIVQRLKQIDGRAPVSIMSNSVKPDDLQIRSWLDEGLSIECHTIDHPCPLLRDGDFAAARSTYDRCVDLMATIPGNTPVAFRMPCCDSLNTVSPRFFAEIFSAGTPAGRALQIDSSVFQFFTSDDPEIPRKLIINPDGGDRFLRYMPRGRGFVNFIENFPYPYVINQHCWEFPCVAPSDWSAQHLQGVNNPVTVEDWKAAIDITVRKQGVFCLVFHPHGWIRNDQIVDLIEHAVQQHGRRIKFLTFREAATRLQRVTPGPSSTSLRATPELLDVNNDGYADAVSPRTRSASRTVRLWSPENRRWQKPQPMPAGHVGRYQNTLAVFDEHGSIFHIARGTTFGRIDARFENDLAGLQLVPLDLDSDGTSELIGTSTDGSRIWQLRDNVWHQLPFGLPADARWATETQPQANCRLLDLDDDGLLDFLLSDARRWGVWRLESLDAGFRRVSGAVRDGDETVDDAPLPIVRTDGSDNGFFVHGRTLCWQNEDTAGEPHLIVRRSFDQLLKPDPARPLSPQASLRTLQPRPGFRVELVAAEPLIADPVAFDWLPDGRLAVVEMGGYPSGTDGPDESNGRVRLLSDTDHDGRFDTAVTFLDKLNFPTGIIAWRDGVLVSAAPDILYAADTTGDGIADHREVLFTGFAEGNQQHRVNGFEFGLDNWLHLANGDSGGTVRSVRTHDTVNARGHDVAIGPTTGDLRLVTGRSQFGRHRDRAGNWFGCNNSHPLFHYVLNQEWLNRNPRLRATRAVNEVPQVPGNAPVYPASRTPERFNDFHTANRFTSACSSMIYDDELFGRHFSGNAFTCEPVHNLVSRLVLAPAGVTFTGQRAVDEADREFLASRDNWFRPVFIRTGPDGALWIADMYRQVIEHPEWIPEDWQNRLDLRAGHDRGRIYRVAPVRPTDVATPSPFPIRAHPEGLVSPVRWVRDATQHAIVQTGETFPMTDTKILRNILEAAPSTAARMHALCTLDGLQALESADLQVALTDNSPLVRRHAIRLSRRRLSADAAILDGVLRTAAAPHSTELLTLVAVLGESDDPRAATALAGLLRVHASDPYVSATILSGLRSSSLTPLLSAVMESPDAEPDLVQSAFGLAATSRQDVSAAARVIADARPTDNNLASVRRRLWALQGLCRDLTPPADLRSGLDEREQRQLDELLRMASAAIEDARCQTHSVEFVVDSIHCAAAYARASGREFADVREAAENLLQPQVPPAVQLAAVEAIAGFPQREAAECLVGRFRQATPATRRAIANQLLSRPAWARQLLEAVRQQSITAAALTATVRQRLLEHPDAHLRQLAREQFGASPKSGRTAIVQQTLQTLPDTADVAAGRTIFEKHCATCHELDGVGQQIGADLTSLAQKSPEVLLTAILDPNRAVEARFLGYTVVTTNGRTFSGMIQSESGPAVTLIGADGRPTTILRENIDQLTSTGRSLMPEGLEKDLTTADLANLIAFLRAGTGADRPKAFVGNQPRLVTPDKDGSLRLTARDCEIRGPNLVFESHFGNLGFWREPEDQAAWRIGDVPPGDYDVFITLAAPDDMAGQWFVIGTQSQTLKAVVKPTGGWNRYRQFAVGRLRMDSPTTVLTLRSDGPLDRYLMDFRELELRPVR